MRNNFQHVTNVSLTLFTFYFCRDIKGAVCNFWNVWILETSLVEICYCRQLMEENSITFVVCCVIFSMQQYLINDFSYHFPVYLLLSLCPCPHWRPPRRLSSVSRKPCLLAGGHAHWSSDTAAHSRSAEPQRPTATPVLDRYKKTQNHLYMQLIIFNSTLH